MRPNLLRLIPFGQGGQTHRLRPGLPRRLLAFQLFLRMFQRENLAFQDVFGQQGFFLLAAQGILHGEQLLRQIIPLLFEHLQLLGHGPGPLAGGGGGAHGGQFGHGGLIFLFPIASSRRLLLRQLTRELIAHLLQLLLRLFGLQFQLELQFFLGGFHGGQLGLGFRQFGDGLDIGFAGGFDGCLKFRPGVLCFLQFFLPLCGFGFGLFDMRCEFARQRNIFILGIRQQRAGAD